MAAPAGRHRARGLARAARTGRPRPRVTEEHHAAQLTRDDITATVHYVRFELTPAQVAALRRAEPCGLAVDHPEYREAVELSAATVAELAADAAS